MGRLYESIEAEAGGWSPWVYPIQGHGNRNYRMRCCDCLRVHEMQFRVVQNSRNRLSVKFRVGWSNRATAASRRMQGAVGSQGSGNPVMGHTAAPDRLSSGALNLSSEQKA